MWAGANDRQKLERLCRYIARPAVSNERIALTEQGQVRYTLKTPYRDGTTHVFFNPLDFMARLAALAPKPRMNLTRFHGVFAPNSKLRAQITPAKRGQRSERAATAPPAERHQATCAERSRSMSWAQRLKRVFQIDIERCEHCGGNVRILVSIEAPDVIGRILKHLDSHPARGPPDTEAQRG